MNEHISQSGGWRATEAAATANEHRIKKNKRIKVPFNANDVFTDKQHTAHIFTDNFSLVCAFESKASCSQRVLNENITNFKAKREKEKFTFSFDTLFVLC